MQKFTSRVFGIAMTDSVHSMVHHSIPHSLQKFLCKVKTTTTVTVCLATSVVCSREIGFGCPFYEREKKNAMTAIKSESGHLMMLRSVGSPTLHSSCPRASVSGPCDWNSPVSKIPQIVTWFHYSMSSSRLFWLCCPGAMGFIQLFSDSLLLISARPAGKGYKTIKAWEFPVIHYDLRIQPA